MSAGKKKRPPVGIEKFSEIRKDSTMLIKRDLSVTCCTNGEK